MNKSLRSLLVFLLAGSMILQPLSVLAETDAGKTDTRRRAAMELIQRGSLVYAEPGSGTGQRLSGIAKSERERVRELIYSGLVSVETEIDVSEYELTSDELKEIVVEVLNTSPELFYVGKGYSYSVLDDGAVISFYPEYEMAGESLTEEDIARMNAETEAVVESVLSKVNPEWSDREKALYIHDYLVAQYEYDTRDPKAADPCRYDMYSLLVEGRAVCQGYSLTYMYFMKRLGISCVVMPSDSMNHMWNQIQIEGEWYHVDVTWDDPLNAREQDMPGGVSHDHFLLSDSAMTGMAYTWDAEDGHECTDTTYDSYFWKNSESPVAVDGTTWFFVKSDGDDAGIYRWDPEADPAARQAEKIVDLSVYRWRAGENTFYQEKFTKIAVHGSKVYYNTPDQVLCFDTEISGTITGEGAEAVMTGISGTVFGIRLRDETLEYITATTESGVIIPVEPQTVCVFEAPDPTYPPLTTSEPSVESADTQTPSVPGSLSPVSGTDGGTGVSQTTPEPSEAPSSEVLTEPAAVQTPSVSECPAPEKTVRYKIKVTAHRGKKKIVVYTPKRAKTVIRLNRKIIRKGKKRCRRITISAGGNLSGKVVLKLSSKIKKGLRIRITVYAAGKKYRSTVIVKRR